MNRNVLVHLLPVLYEPEEVRGGIAVILDILRSSTTITHALAHGATAVIPSLEVATAQRIAGGFPGDAVLTGGERGGVLIPGFDLDNNPFAYASDVVRGKTIVFTTTNGTRALQRSAPAARILIGAFVNFTAVVRILTQDPRPVHLVCAGTDGKITIEDALGAGAIALGLAAAVHEPIEEWADDQLQIAVRLYRDATQSPEAFRRAMRNSSGGRTCRRLGFDDQIDRAATFDLFDIVPEYQAETGRITP